MNSIRRPRIRMLTAPQFCVATCSMIVCFAMITTCHAQEPALPAVPAEASDRNLPLPLEPDVPATTPATVDPAAGESGSATEQDPLTALPAVKTGADEILPPPSADTDSDAQRTIICLYQGQPLSKVTVNTFRRQTPGGYDEFATIEAVDNLMTNEDGRVSIKLPPGTGTEGQETQTDYLLYFTADGHAVRSIVVGSDRELPEFVDFSERQKEPPYVPAQFLVIANEQGIQMGRGISGFSGFSDSRSVQVSGIARIPDSMGSTGSSVSITATPAPSSTALKNAPTGTATRTPYVEYPITFGPPVFLAQPPATSGTGYRTITPSPEPEKLAAAIEKLRSAASEEDRTAARSDVRTALVQIFNNDMQSREQQAQEIETRLQKLRNVYQQREAKRDEIINLQVQVLEKGAAGLEFPGITVPATTTSQLNPGANRINTPVQYPYYTIEGPTAISDPNSSKP
ncbi:MAG: hypothetical protein KDA85_21840, partial [Planctomycetaceae bacterium]|nr:hypothetical protein [Planctomycetaceae bacterium]